MSLSKKTKTVHYVFGIERTVVMRHIGNIFKDGEIDKKSTSANFALVQIEGKLKVSQVIQLVPFWN